MNQERNSDVRARAKIWKVGDVRQTDRALEHSLLRVTV